MDSELIKTGALIALMTYVVSVLFFRLGIKQRDEDRRLKDRRVSHVHAPIERRSNSLDRRQLDRRG